MSGRVGAAGYGASTTALMRSSVVRMPIAW
jgi:hypothetical protein